jgi:hypothetical protein
MNVAITTPTTAITSTAMENMGMSRTKQKQTMWKAICSIPFQWNVKAAWTNATRFKI